MIRAVRTTWLKSIDDSKSPKQITLELGELNPIAISRMLRELAKDGKPVTDEDGNEVSRVSVARDIGEGKTSIAWLDGDERFQLKGIYELDSNQLQYCMAQPGKERPRNFKVARGSGHTLVRLKRFSTGEQDVEKRLRLASVQIGKDNIGWITHLTFPRITGKPDSLLALAPRLKKLDGVSFIDSPIQENSLKHLAASESLKSLSITSDAQPVAGLGVLASARQLTWVSLNGWRIDDQVLGEVAQIKSIEGLSLHLTSVTKNGIGKLTKAIPTLTRLDLTGLNLTNESLKPIAQLRRLKSLVIANSNVTDDGMTHLSRLSNIETLMIRNTKVSDRGFAELINLQKLGSLQLDGTRVTDESLKLIAASFPKLNTLSIMKLGSGVTDEGLLALAKHQTLSHIELSRDHFSKSAIEEVQQKRDTLFVSVN